VFLIIKILSRLLRSVFRTVSIKRIEFSLPEVASEESLSSSKRVDRDRSQVIKNKASVI
jgi:hypothetical protein